MKPLFLTITAADWFGLHRSLFTSDGHENAGVLLCGRVETERTRRLLVRSFVPVPVGRYTKRQAYHLEIAPSFYNEIISNCLKDGLSPVIVHSHPHHGEAQYSDSDDFGEKRLLGALQALLPQSWPASLVVTHDAVAGRELGPGGFVTLAGLTVSGSRIQKHVFGQSPLKETDVVRFDRQVRAFGDEGQRLISSLHVGIIGVGGIGSLVAEQIARLGVEHLILVDDDSVEATNLNRLVGAATQDVGELKATVIAKHVSAIGLGRVRTILDSAIRQSVLLQLRECDLVFLCVDNDRTRALLNRFAHQYLIPVIDHGTRLDGRIGVISAAAGRVSVTGAGFTCLRCSHHLNPERIRVESMPKDERGKLQQEGYIMGIDEPAPAVITINTVIAGLGATAGINLFVSLTGKPQPLNQIYDATSGVVFTVNPIHEPGCDICDNNSGVKALGDNQIVSAYD